MRPENPKIVKISKILVAMTVRKKNTKIGQNAANPGFFIHPVYIYIYPKIRKKEVSVTPPKGLQNS